MTRPITWTRESQIWDAMKKSLPEPHWQRIESPMTGAGRADVEGAWQGVTVWIENKIVRSEKIAISDRQIAWHQKRAAVGGRSFIVAWDKQNQLLRVWRGKDARALQDVKLRNLPSAPDEVHFPAPIDWEGFQDLVFLAPLN